MWRVLSVMALIPLTSASSSVAAERERESLSSQEAAQLVVSALPEKTAAAPGLEIQQMSDPYFPEFYFFEVLWKNPGPGSVVAGHFAVHRRSGEVWDPLLCRRIVSSSLEQMQQRIRKRIGLSRQEYAELRRQAPCTIEPSVSKPRPDR